MTSIAERIDNWLARRGFIKAGDIPRRFDVGTVFSGEAPIGDGLYSAAEDNLEAVERLAVTTTWVYSDLAMLSQTLGAAEFGVYEKKGEQLEAVENHEFEVLLEWPTQTEGQASLFDQSWLLEYTGWWLWLHGEAYWYLATDGTGTLRQIWPLPANRMKPIPDPKTYIRGYTYTSRQDGQPKEIPIQNVCYFRRPNIFDYHRGLSVLTALRLPLEADREAVKWNTNNYKEGMTLDGILGVPAELNDVDFERVKAEIKTEVDVNRRKWLLARSGDLSWVPVGVTQEAAQFLETRQFTRDEIDRAFLIPEGYWSAVANRATANAAKASVIEASVWPMARAVARAITGQIILPYYGENLRGKFKDMRPRDRQLEVMEARQYWMVKTVNEAREDLELNPLEDKELGETLVPLAVKGQPTPFGGGGSPFPALSAGPEGNEATEAAQRALRDDLRRWESIAKRRLKAGDDPAGYEFESAYIPLEAKAGIVMALEQATTEEEVKAAFAAGFCDGGDDQAAIGLHDWSAYP